MTFPRLTLTARLTFLFTGAAALVLLGLGVLLSWVTDRHFVELDQTYLEDKVHLVEKLVRDNPDPGALKNSIDDLLDSHSGFYVQIWLDGQLFYGVSSLTAGEAPSIWPKHELREWRFGDQRLRGFVQEAPLRQAPTAAPLASSYVQILVAVDTAHHAHFLASMKRTLALYLLAATAMCALLAWWAARRGLAPLKTMRDRATAVTSQSLEQRMPVESVPVEFAELATTLNGMLNRLERDFQRLMDFSGDLAHELRTPLSNLLTQTQVALSKNRSPEAYRDVLASNAEEFERLARMVSDMLLLAKTESGIDLPHPEQINLRQDVLALFDFYEAVADEKHVRLQCTGDAQIQGDRLMLRRAISNLLSNALRHADGDTEVSIEIVSQPDCVEVAVVNHGAAISPADLPRLFDRFYRGDKSRAHPASEGAGLGLAITKALIAAHGGRIAVISAGGVTRFQFSLPLRVMQSLEAQP